MDLLEQNSSLNKLREGHGLVLVYHILTAKTYEKSIQVEPEAEALDGVLVTVENSSSHSCEGLYCIWGP
jgi:hypothetical protein